MSGKLEVPLAPGWRWELDLSKDLRLGSPMGRGANQGQRNNNKGFDETGGPMGAQATQGQRSMGLLGQGKDEKFLIWTYDLLLSHRVGSMKGSRGLSDTQTPPETCPPCPCDRYVEYGPKWQDNLILY